MVEVMEVPTVFATVAPTVLPQGNTGVGGKVENVSAFNKSTSGTMWKYSIKQKAGTQNLKKKQKNI